jgi:hypothetical protein
MHISADGTPDDVEAPAPNADGSHERIQRQYQTFVVAT